MNVTRRSPCSQSLLACVESTSSYFASREASPVVSLPPSVFLLAALFLSFAGARRQLLHHLPRDGALPGHFPVLTHLHGNIHGFADGVRELIHRPLRQIIHGPPRRARQQLLKPEARLQRALWSLALVPLARLHARERIRAAVLRLLWGRGSQRLVDAARGRAPLLFAGFIVRVRRRVLRHASPHSSVLQAVHLLPRRGALHRGAFLARLVRRSDGLLQLQAEPRALLVLEQLLQPLLGVLLV
mmetsp:Transcript_1578/g.3597  ORF Transcript_1578/g.3597 Transcript_1578/m.3597 type:complete len:243 (+) Transcript_1578:28-756(+)